jgi:hypothetical protein
MINVIGSVVYRVRWGEIGGTGFFCESAQNLVVKFLEVSIARWTLGGGRGGSDCRHGMGTDDG